MATLYSDVMTDINAGKAVGPQGFPGSDGTQEYKLPVATYTITSATAASDVIQMVQQPANTFVTRGYLRWEDCGTTIDADLGYTGGVVDCLVDGAALGTAGIFELFDAASPTTAADRAASLITTADTIDLLINSASALTVGQDIELHVWVQKIQNT